MNIRITSQKFLKLTFLLIFIYILYHVTIWYLYSSNIFGRDDNLYIGDLGRMSYQVDSLYPRKLQYTLEKNILNHKKNYQYHNEKVDILTIGDSFSNGVMGGKNPYYQDFIATKYNKNILNIMNLSHGEHHLFTTIIALYNNGWLKEHKPEMIIIESAERGVYERFAKDFDFSIDTVYINRLIQPTKLKESYIPNLLMINSANYKLPFYTIKYNFKNRAQKDVVKLTLTKKLFTPKNFQNKILFHYSDVTNIKNDKQLAKKINDNFNKLALMLKNLNIKLVFMPVVDKYDLYYNFVKNNPYPKNNFFSMMQTLSKNYIFVDTKKILLEQLSSGIKNLYYPDDTHWSYKASSALISNKIFSDNLK